MVKCKAAEVVAHLDFEGGFGSFTILKGVD
jgi:hypothetical protein